MGICIEWLFIIQGMSSKNMHILALLYVENAFIDPTLQRPPHFDCLALRLFIWATVVVFYARVVTPATMWGFLSAGSRASLR